MIRDAESTMQSSSHGAQAQAMVRSHWTGDLATWVADRRGTARRIGAYVRSASDFVGRQIEKLQRARFGEPSMAQLRALYLNKNDQTASVVDPRCRVAVSWGSGSS